MDTFMFQSLEKCYVIYLINCFTKIDIQAIKTTSLLSQICLHRCLKTEYFIHSRLSPPNSRLRFVNFIMIFSPIIQAFIYYARENVIHCIGYRYAFVVTCFTCGSRFMNTSSPRCRKRTCFYWWIWLNKSKKMKQASSILNRIMSLSCDILN